MNRRQFVEASGVLGLLLAAGMPRGVARAQTTYSSVDLGMPEGYDAVIPIALNENGVAAIAASAGDEQAIFTVADGVFTRVGRNDSAAYGVCIDGDGNVGGWIEDSGNGSNSARDVPIILTAGNQSEMPGDPLDGRVLAIQQGGTAVGEAAEHSGTARRKAVIWTNQEVSQLKGTPKDGASSARDINALGQIVGWIEEGDGESASRKAVLFSLEADPVEIAGLGGTQSEAVAISQQGQVVGNSATADTPTELGGDGTAAFIWANGTATPLLELEGQRWSMAADVNSYGLVAGTIGLSAPATSGAATTAVVWGADAVFDLNQNAQRIEGVTLTTAVAVNELGQVLCGGIDANGKSHAVLLSIVGN